MSNTIKLSSAVLLKSPKGYGMVKNNTKGQNIGFTNAITIYGKKHLLNSLTSFLALGGNYTQKLPKLIGLSIMFRRCGTGSLNGQIGTSDPPTKESHKLTKGFFEHIYGVYGGADTNVTKTVNKSSLTSFINTATCGFKLEDINPGTDTGGMWGATTEGGSLECIDPDTSNIWHDTGTNEGDAPKSQNVHQCLKDDSSAPGFGFAKIVGISVLTSELGGYAGGAQLPTSDGSTPNGNTIKVWRDPTFMELIHQQESLREPGSGDYEIPPYSTPHTPQSLGHYFPNKDHFTAINTVVELNDSISAFQLGDSDLIGSCDESPATNDTKVKCDLVSGIWTPSHNNWEWKHTAIDTFAFSGFVTHWYGANEGAGGDQTGSPFINLDLTNRTADNTSYNGRKFDSLGNLQTTVDADYKWYAPIARQAGNFNNPTTLHGYEYADPAYWAWGDHDSLETTANITTDFGGDGLLEDQITGFEINYDKLNSQAPLDQENFIDHNDTISTQYTINFDQSTSYETALDTNINTGQNNSLGTLVTTIGAKLGVKWAKDFGYNAGEVLTAHVSNWGTAENSAIRGIRLFDKSGRIMMAKTTGGNAEPLGYVADSESNFSNFDNQTHSFSVFTLTKVDNTDKSVHVKDIVQIDNSMISDPAGYGSDYIIDNTSKRPRILVNTIRLFFNQLNVNETETSAGERKPHRLEIYGVGEGGSSTAVADDLMFTFILGSSLWQDNIADGLANPFKGITLPGEGADGDILSNATADWTSGNHLDLTLKFVMV